MSLRWKLFRFLRVETLLAAPPPDTSEAEISLFPSLSAPEASSPRDALLTRFSSAAGRSLHSHALDGLYAFALPRAVVHLFHIAARPNTPPPISPHLSFSPHDSAVVAVRLVPGPTPTDPPWLVTLGQDDNAATVKIWSFRPIGTRNDSPQTPPEWSSTNTPDVRPECQASFRLQGDARPTALAASITLSSLAVGFTDGSITIFSGELTRERSVRARVAPAAGEMIETRPIVFLQYANDLLYAVSELSVVAVTPVAPVNGQPAFRRDVLDNFGAQSPRLCCVLDETAELVVAKPEALYFFNRDGRGPCLAFPTVGERALIAGVGNYIIHCTGQGATTAYDVVNKLIAYRGKGIVSCAFRAQSRSDRVGVMLCFHEGSILQLSEISLEDRVNMLLKRGLYVPAVSLARAESSRVGDSSMHNRALRQYAEYLMTKDRYDDAADQLIGTITGDIEPSWVITRLVEQPGLRSGLRLYLEALHKAGRAAFAHTKVLITCYRHDRARGAILGSKAIEKTTDEYVINVFSDVDWSEEQVDASIALCRDAGLYKVAERVSRRRGRYVQLARTLVEDLDEVPKTLDLLCSIPEFEVVKVIRAVGRQLLVKDSEAFVLYLSDAICRSTADVTQGPGGPVLRLEMFLPLFIDMPRWRASLLQRILSKPGGIPTAEARKAWILLFESLVCVDLCDRTLPSDRPSTSTGAISVLGGEGPSADLDSLSESSRGTPPSWGVNPLLPPSSRVRSKRPIGRRALKILQSRWSVIDLRAALEVAEQYGHEPCLEYLYEHLRMYKELGMTLRLVGNGPSLVRACRRHGDREPSLWVEAIRLFVPLAAQEEYGRDRKPSGGSGVVVDTSVARRDGRADENEDIDVVCESIDGGGRGRDSTDRISFDIVSKELSEADSDRGGGGSAQEVVDEAMLMLDRSGALSSLEIIDIAIESCPDGAWGVVREYFERVCAGLRKEAGNAEHGGLLLATELEELRGEARRLGEEPVVIKPRSCTACEDAVSVPAVHFFCGHSYHAGCLAPGGGAVGGGGGVGSVVGGYEPHTSEERQGVWAEECPKCAPELDAMVSMRQAMEEKNSRHDEFFATLKGARDGFAVVVEFLERSPFI